MSCGRGAAAFGVRASAFGGASVCDRRAPSLRPRWDHETRPTFGSAAVKRFALLAALALLAPSAAAQRPNQLPLVGPGGAAGAAIPIGYHRGYAAVPLASMARIGWTVASTDGGGVARRGDERVELIERSPFFRWSGSVLQLTAEPYRMGDDLWVPLQLLSDFLPERRAEEYAFRAGGIALEVKTADAWTPQGVERSARAAESRARDDRPAATPPPSSRPTPVPPRTRVVVID